MKSTTIPLAPTFEKGTRFAKLDGGQRFVVDHSTPSWTRVRFRAGRTMRIRTHRLHDDWTYAQY